MRAVNLVPVERRAAAAGAGAGADPVQLAVLGVLAVLLLSAGGWAYLRHDAGSLRTEAAETSRRSAAAEQQATALAPAVALQTERREREQKVAQLAAGRVDWSIVFTRLAGATPGGVRLTNVEATDSGASGDAAGTATTSSTTPTAAAGPSLALTACASSQRLVARTLDGYRAAEGVADVTLTSSTRAGSGDGGGGGCSGVTMVATVALSGSAGAAAAATGAATTGATGSAGTAAGAGAPTTTSTEPAPIPGASEGSEGATQ